VSQQLSIEGNIVDVTPTAASPASTRMKRRRNAARLSALLVVLLSINLEQPDLGLAIDPLGIDESILGYADPLGLLLGPDLGIADANRRAGTRPDPRSRFRSHMCWPMLR